MPANNSFYLSTRAESDIETLYDDTCDRLSLGSAEGLVLNISIAFRRLAETDDRAEDCSHISPGLRAWPVDSHMIYFRREADGVNILRVLHQSQHHPARLSH